MSDPKVEEKKTLDESGQPIEKKQEAGEDTPKTDAPKEVPLTPEEIEKLKKKAADFDGLIEKQRLAKLTKKEETPKNDDEVNKKLEEVLSEVASLRKENADTSLTEAFKEFTKEMPWAVGDEYFNKISESFSADGLKTKDDYITKLRAITISLFPGKYSEHKENEIKSRVLADAAKINAGDGGGSSNSDAGIVTNKIKTEEELRKERLGALLRKNLTWFPKK
ncbi:hypothetical protein HGB13_00170 [bacterium]|nr:hypothetical protein [bacterium]